MAGGGWKKAVGELITYPLTNLSCRVPVFVSIGNLYKAKWLKAMCFVCCDHAADHQLLIEGQNVDNVVTKSIHLTHDTCHHRTGATF